jgi:hypothetical protein
MQVVTTVGLDIAKSVFQVRAAACRRRLPRFLEGPIFQAL